MFESTLISCYCSSLKVSIFGDLTYRHRTKRSELWHITGYCGNSGDPGSISVSGSELYQLYRVGTSAFHPRLRS
jgi:hypothetical protein